MTLGVAGAPLAGAAWLTEGPLAHILRILDRDGEEARVVGGAVRNALLGEPPGDFDVATTALPQDVATRLRRAGFKVVPTGIAHGTVTAVAGEAAIEITTLREDVETFGRHATVRFGRDWRADAERRDFTMNALSVSRDGIVHDCLGGLADLAARRVRFIGDAQTRIREDYLRILRFFRFHATYGRGSLDAAGFAAAVLEREGLRHLSRERIGMELRKLILAPRAGPVLDAMADAGVLGLVLAGVALVPRLTRLAEIEAALKLPSDAVRRLGALALHTSDDTERLRERLRLSNAEAERLAAMAERAWEADPAEAHAGRVLLYRLGPERFRDRVLFAWAAKGAARDDPSWRAFLDLPERWTAPRFPIKAADLVARGVPPGPALGAALRAAEDAWIAADFPEAPEPIARIVTEAMSPTEG